MSSVSIPIPRTGRLRTYAAFVRLEHTLFSLPLILAGIFSAPAPAMSWRRWTLVVVAAVGARTAAMALNRLIDRRIDALNPRTRGRELPSGTMRLGEAVALLLVSTAAYLLACAALGRWYLEVAAVPLAVFLIYPYLKRWTPLCHFGVGLALALAPLAGYAAAHPRLDDPKPALWLAAFALTWVSGFDIIYATLDEDFDRGHGVHSMVAWLGRRRSLFISAALHAAAFACVIVALFHMGAWRGGMNGLEIYFNSPWPRWVAHTFALALAALAALLFLEVKWAADVDLAFFKVNVVVGFVVLALVLLVRVGMANLTVVPGLAR
jgi:4-hydroxybenzoate polyprenyltransferase